MRIFEEIESVHFAITLGVCSGVHCFITNGRQLPEYLSLIEQYDEETVISRIEKLTQRDFDRQYAYPWSEALGIYILVLFDKKSQRLKDVVTDILSQKTDFGLWPIWIAAELLQKP